MSQKFTGTERYVATEDLMMAVNAAVTLARPLLVKGEPGTGKTRDSTARPRFLVSDCVTICPRPENDRSHTQWRPPVTCLPSSRPS